MKKLSRPILSPSKFAIALSLAHISFLSPLTAAEQVEKEDPHHDRAILIAMSKHNLIREHFIVPEGKTVPIYDVNDHIRFSAGEIHTAQLEKYQNNLLAATPVVSPTKAVSSSPKSILANIAALPGHLLYSPVYFYNMLPNLRSTPKASSNANEVADSETRESDDIADFVEIINDAKGESSAESKDRKATTEDREDSRTKSTFSSRRFTIIYSGDGGGSKGLIPASVIAYMEKKTNTPMGDIFDHTMGTSISGIQVLSWTTNNTDGKPIMSGADTVSLMENDSASIFSNNYKWYITSKIFGLKYPQFDPAPFEQRLQGIFGTTTFANARTNVYVSTIVSATNELLVINNREHPTVLTWEGARGTSAAPTKFPGYQAKSLPDNPILLDGGIVLNNPADYILDEVTTYENSVGNRNTEMVLFSAGTGRQPINPIPKNAGLLNGVMPIIEAFTESQVLATHLTMQRRLQEGKTYFRADARLSEYIPLDTLTPDSIRVLQAAAESQYDLVDKFIETDAVRLKLEAK